jgi:hypothetical protein
VSAVADIKRGGLCYMFFCSSSYVGYMCVCMEVHKPTCQSRSFQTSKFFYGYPIWCSSIISFSEERLELAGSLTRQNLHGVIMYVFGVHEGGTTANCIIVRDCLDSGGEWSIVMGVLVV